MNTVAFIPSDGRSLENFEQKSYIVWFIVYKDRESLENRSGGEGMWQHRSRGQLEGI